MQPLPIYFPYSNYYCWYFIFPITINCSYFMDQSLLKYLLHAPMQRDFQLLHHYFCLKFLQVDSEYLQLFMILQLLTDFHIFCFLFKLKLAYLYWQKPHYLIVAIIIITTTAIATVVFIITELIKWIFLLTIQLFHQSYIWEQDLHCIWIFRVQMCNNYPFLNSLVLYDILLFF